MNNIIQPASLWRRLAAAVYDVLLLVAVWFGAAVVALVARQGETVPAGTWWFTCYLLAVGFVFFGWFWTHGGQTLGMRAWRMQVRGTDGSGLTWLQALQRYLVALPSWLSIVGMLWCLIDAQRRALHDIASGSEVVLLPRNNS